MIIGAAEDISSRRLLGTDRLVLFEYRRLIPALVADHALGVGRYEHFDHASRLAVRALKLFAGEAI